MRKYLKYCSSHFGANYFCARSTCRDALACAWPWMLSRAPGRGAAVIRVVPYDGMFLLLALGCGDLLGLPRVLLAVGLPSYGLSRKSACFVACFPLRGLAGTPPRALGREAAVIRTFPYDGMFYCLFPSAGACWDAPACSWPWGCRPTGFRK